MKLYEFNPDDAYRFAREQNIHVLLRGDELRFQHCPYCGGGPSHHDKNTFAINLVNGSFNCKRSSCGRTGNMITLHRDFGFSLGEGIDSYYDRESRYRRFKRPAEKIESKPAAVAYMESRGISRRITELYEITTKEGADNILVFPFPDEQENIWFIKYRNTTYQKGDNGSKEWCERDRKPILFGMNHCNFENRTLVMTEGQIDSLSCAEAGIENAVSVPLGKNGFTWVPYCWNFLNRFNELIIFGDLEGDQITLLKDMTTRFRGRIKSVRKEDYKGCKDANEILQKYGPEAVRAAVANAEPIKVRRLTNLKDVQRVDLSKLEKISTGIHALDNLIGGFYFGQLIALTGPRGDGKSTLASQFAAFALGQGLPVYVYSGEMNNSIVRAWLDEQLTGKDYMIYNANANIYEITKEMFDCLQKWDKYKYCWMFDDLWTEDQDETGEESDSEETEKDIVLETLEEAIISNGIKFAVIDNLMTAMDFSANTDLNQAQSVFVKRLSRLAKKYNVIIVLVAHPRKSGLFKTLTNDDVAGSSNITNLCDMVITYSRPKDEETDADRIMTVLKDRNAGHTDYDGFPLYFEAASRRISSNKDFSWKFGWEPDTIPVDDDDEIPFL